MGVVAQSQLPSVPEGSPPWVYAVGVGAFVALAGIGALPNILDKLRRRFPPEPDSAPPDPASTSRPAPVAMLPGQIDASTALLSRMIDNLEERFAQAGQHNQELRVRLDELEERYTQQAIDLARARAEVENLRVQLRVLTERRGGP